MRKLKQTTANLETANFYRHLLIVGLLFICTCCAGMLPFSQTTIDNADKVKTAITQVIEKSDVDEFDSHKPEIQEVSALITTAIENEKSRGKGNKVVKQWEIVQSSFGQAINLWEQQKKLGAAFKSEKITQLQQALDTIKETENLRKKA